MLKWHSFVQWEIKYQDHRQQVLRPLCKVSFGCKHAKQHAVERLGFPPRGTAAQCILEGRKLRLLLEHFDLSDEERELLGRVVDSIQGDPEVLCYHYDALLRALPLFCRKKCAKFLQGVR